MDYHLQYPGDYGRVVYLWAANNTVWKTDIERYCMKVGGGFRGLVRTSDG